MYLTTMKPVVFAALLFAVLMPGLAWSQANYEPSLNNVNSNVADARFNVFMDPIYGYGSTENLINFSSRNYWAERAGQHPLDAAAWFNYYKATRYMAEGSSGFAELQADLDTITAHLRTRCAGTWEQLIVEYWNSNRDPQKESLVLRALQMKPDDPLTLRFMTGIQYLHNMTGKAAEYYNRWQATGDTPLSTDRYAYNVLQSLPADAIIFTNGEMDTYPLLNQLQENGVNTIKVISLAWLARPENRRAIFANHGLTLPAGYTIANAEFIMKVAEANAGKRIYLASTVDSGILSALSGKLYCTGLAFRYSVPMLEHVAFLRENVGTKMRLEGVGKAISSAHYFDLRFAAMLEMNYYLPLLMAADSYAELGNTDRAKELRAKAKLVRTRAGYDEPLRYEGE